MATSPPAVLQTLREPTMVLQQHMRRVVVPNILRLGCSYTRCKGCSMLTSWAANMIDPTPMAQQRMQ